MTNPILEKINAVEREVTANWLPSDIARCEGQPAGPQGLQVAEQCKDCLRRTAPRAEVQWFTSPPVEFPCPMKIYPDATERN